MKSTLICIVSILTLNVLIAQNDASNASNSPGSEESVATKSSSTKNEADVQYLQEEIDRKAEQVESKYFVEKEIFNSYNSTYSTTTVAVKKKIYRASEILLEYNNDKLDNLPITAYTDRYFILKQVDKIYNRMLELSREDDTRKLEKKLKKLKKPSDIQPVFFGED